MLDCLTFALRGDTARSLLAPLTLSILKSAERQQKRMLEELKSDPHLLGERQTVRLYTSSVDRRGWGIVVPKLKVCRVLVPCSCVFYTHRGKKRRIMVCIGRMS